MISNNLYDLFGVLRYQQGSAETPWRMEVASTDVESLLNASGWMFLLTRSFQTTRWSRWSWKWPPFRMRTPRWLYPPRGFWYGVCLASCGVVIWDLLANYRSSCAGLENFTARLHCALCTTWRRGGGMQVAIQGCGGCLCGLFGGGLVGGFLCGWITAGLMEVLCATYPQPEPPPVPRYPQPYPSPVPMPPYGPI